MQGETASTALFKLKQHLPAAPPATRCLVVWQVSHESILQTDWGQPDDVSDDVTVLRVYWSTNTTVTAAETTISPFLLFYLCTCSVIWHMCDGSANLPCMEHESVQQQTVKTASGYIWRRIIQFPWKPGDPWQLLRRRTLTLVLSPRHSSSLKLQIQESPTFQAADCRWSWGQRSELPDRQSVTHWTKDSLQLTMNSRAWCSLWRLQLAIRAIFHFFND